jgi:hypothetical protein
LLNLFLCSILAIIVCLSVIFYWPTENHRKTCHTMVNRKSQKDMSYQGQQKITERHHGMTCLSVIFCWPWYDMSFCDFLLTMVWHVFLWFSVDPGMTCLSVIFYWPWYDMSFSDFLLTMVWHVFLWKTCHTMVNRKSQKDMSYHGQ